MALKTETNTAKMEERILEAAKVSPSVEPHANLSADFEHGQWWITCLDCDAQWSVVDAIGGPAVDGFDFERITDGFDPCGS